MSIRVKAKQTKMNVGTVKGSYRFVMQAVMYNRLDDKKVIYEAALRSGIPVGSINAAWAAIGEVIKAWATEGHSVAVPGLGSMRFSLSAQTVEDVADVSSSLIRRRKVLFTPNMDIKAELARTAVNITCYDKNGDIMKQVVSTDSGNIDDGADDDDTRTDNQGDGNGNIGSGSGDGDNNNDNGQTSL